MPVALTSGNLNTLLEQPCNRAPSDDQKIQAIICSTRHKSVSAPMRLSPLESFAVSCRTTSHCEDFRSSWRSSHPTANVAKFDEISEYKHERQVNCIVCTYLELPNNMFEDCKRSRWFLMRNRTGSPEKLGNRRN